MSGFDKIDFDNSETCPNCGQYIGDEATCPFCGVVIYKEDELNEFDEDNSGELN